MEIRLYFQMLRRGWWIVLLTTLTALAVALAISYLAIPQYTALARFIVNPSGMLTTGNEVISSLDTLNNQSIMATYAAIMNSSRVYNETLAFMKFQPDALKDYTYKAEVLTNSNIIELSVTGPNPEMAAKIANALGNQTINFTNRLNQVFSVEFLDIAMPPVLPTSPKPILNVSLALMLGLVFGIMLAIMNEQLRLPLEVFRQRLHLDEITGVYNRKYFSRFVEEELAQKPDDVLSIGILELNGLRDLVETLPVVSLQKVFNRVTDILHKELRGNDVIGRWDDISFIVMLPSTTGLAAKGIFERIYQMLLQPVSLGQLDTSVELDPHIGGAEYSNNISTQELFEKANGTLEQARRDRDNPIYVWEIKNPFWSQKTLDQE